MIDLSKTIDLSTTYLGLKLKNPLVASSSPMCQDLANVCRIEEFGAAAVVLPSLFEEQIEMESDELDHFITEGSEISAESITHFPELTRTVDAPAAYMKHIEACKRAVKIPVIASLSADTHEGWVRLAQRIEKAGADAVELNIYKMSLSTDTPSSKIEQAYVDITHSVVSAIKIPVSVKLPPFFTNLALISSQLEDAGAKGLIFFNRFFQPDLDLLSMGPGYSLRLTTGAENRLPLRWLSLIYRQVRLDLAAGTGIRTGADVLKMILSGASATQLCSVLLQRGIPWLELIDQDLRHWMEICQVKSLKEAKGILASDPNGDVEGEEYRRALQGYSSIEVPERRVVHGPRPVRRTEKSVTTP